MNDRIKVIKSMIKDLLYCGYSFNDFIDFNYKICEGLEKEYIRLLWIECINELEAL